MKSSRIAPVSRGSMAYPRKRAVTACQVCRARRTKCDQKKPRCSFCERIDAQCISEPASLSTFDPASLAILERLANVEEKLDAIHAAGPEVNTLPLQLSGPLVPPLPESLEKVLGWSIFCSGASPIISTCQKLPSPLSSRLTGDTQPVAISGDELDPNLCAGYLDAFFRDVHVKNPVFHEPSIRTLVRRVCHNGAGWDAESCLALLICANGAISRPFRSPSLSVNEIHVSAGPALFATAQKRMGCILECPGLIQAQCLFLAGVYMMTCMRAFDAWRMFLQALAACQGFGFVQNSSHPQQQNQTGNLAEESIYWSCWKSERELRWELDLPDFRNSSLDSPTLFPSLPQGNEGDTLRSWYFYLSEISLWRLETDAREEITRVSRDWRPGKRGPLLDQLAEVAKSNYDQLVTWQDSLPSIVAILDDNMESDILRFVLRGRETYLLELISWPFIYAIVRQLPSSPAETMSPSAREWASRGLQFHLNRLNINQPGFYHRHHGTWLMMHSSARSAAILLAVALNPSTYDLLPQGWLQAIKDTTDMLHFWCMEVKGMEEKVELFMHLLSNFQH
ncbi:hypothetical protein AAEP93_010515 [Penicillium crustosum]